MDSLENVQHSRATSDLSNFVKSTGDTKELNTSKRHVNQNSQLKSILKPNNSSTKIGNNKNQNMSVKNETQV